MVSAVTFVARPAEACLAMNPYLLCQHRQGRGDTAFVNLETTDAAAFAMPAGRRLTVARRLSTPRCISGVATGNRRDDVKDERIDGLALFPTIDHPRVEDMGSPG